MAACLTSRVGRCLLTILALPGLTYACYLIRLIAPGWWPVAIPRDVVLLLQTGLAIGETAFLAAQPAAPPGAAAGFPPGGLSERTPRTRA